jgi:hypothetical protein
VEPHQQNEQVVSGMWCFSIKRSQLRLPRVGKRRFQFESRGGNDWGIRGQCLYLANDQEKNRLPQRQLDEAIAVFATPGREFKFAFDQDIKVSTVMNVRREMVRGIELLEARGCACKVVKWDGSLNKGLDDLIVNQGH